MFLDEVERVSKIFKSMIKEKKLKIFSHLDADGLCSISILIKMLLREGSSFELRIVKQLTSQVIKEIKIDKDTFLIFSDLGSGQLDLLRDLIEKTHVLILDHHEPIRFEHPNLFHLNPLIFNEEASASMVCYLFAKSLDLKNTDLIDLAIVGAVGDKLDEKWEFKGKLYRKVLEEAETVGKITISKGIRLYGRSTRPIHKALELSFNPFIPGISGSESNAVQFLSELGIPLKQHGEWRKLSELDIEEQKKLASAIILERLKAKDLDAADIFGEIYTIPGRPEELQDAREFATLLNACGRLGAYDVGIRLCLNDLSAIEASVQVINEYRRLISEGIDWLRMSKAIIETNFANYLLGGNKISDTLIGTITSIFLSSNLVNTSKPIFGITESNGNLKISARSSKDSKVNLRDVIVSVAKKIGGEGGGHSKAAGGLIPKNRQKEFIEVTDKTLGEIIGGKEKN